MIGDRVIARRATLDAGRRTRIRRSSCRCACIVPRPASSVQRPAFTLVEMLVAVGVFAIVIGLTSNLFISASRQQTRTTNRIALEADARLIIERIARAMREGFIDASIADADLGIRSRAGERTAFRRATTGCPSGSSSCIAIGRAESGSSALEWASLTSARVRADAFDVMASATLQPYVTIHLMLSVEDRAGERIATEAQTTVVSRAYVQ